MGEAASEAFESGVGLAPEGSGPDVRTITVYRRDPVTGDTVPVRMQVIAVADENGRLIGNDTEWQSNVLVQLGHINDSLQAILEALD